MKWKWRQGSVSETSDHMLLLYGDANQLHPKEFISAARVASPRAGIFTVQFLLEETESSPSPVLSAVRRDLDFFTHADLTPDPWSYAQYHCTTAANWYSDIHWVYHPKGATP